MDLQVINKKIVCNKKGVEGLKIKSLHLFIKRINKIYFNSTTVTPISPSPNVPKPKRTDINIIF